MISSPLTHLRRLYALAPGRGVPRYTAEEVLALLGTEPADSDHRQRSVLATASVPSAWTGYLSSADAWQLGRDAYRLPTILFWHRTGLSLEEIGRRLGLFSGTWQARRALEAAAGCIAARLNDRGLPAARGAW